MKSTLLAPVLGMILASACASTQPPRELIDARAALQRAGSGPASRHALVDLHTARQHLETAEAAYRDEPSADATRDLAYVALRRAQIAEARGEALEADQQRQVAEQERSQFLSQNLVQTQGALAQARQGLSMTSQQLEQERQARMEAERRAQAALESLRQVAAVREEQRGTVITLSGEVLFASGESTLLPIAQQRLDQVAQALRDQGVRRLVVEGHTDSRGNPSDNQQLSLARANAVRNHLITRGLDGSMIEAVGMGSSRPLGDNATAEGRANNRRVEIVVSPSNGAQQSPAPMAPSSQNAQPSQQPGMSSHAPLPNAAQPSTAPADPAGSQQPAVRSATQSPTPPSDPRMNPRRGIVPIR